MRKYRKTFHANEGYKLTVFIGTLFKRYMYENETSQTPTFYMKMSTFLSTLSWDMRQI